MQGGLGKIMEQAKELQEKMQIAQNELAAMEVTGQSGGGLVKVVMTGRHDLKQVTIDPKLFSRTQDADESAAANAKKMIEDLVAAAVNDAVQRIEEETRTRMQSMASGLELPPELQQFQDGQGGE